MGDRLSLLAPKVVRIANRSITLSVLVLSLCRAANGAEAVQNSSRISLDSAASDFGSPPSGEIPILFDDRTVYAKPEVVKRGRVLAALVKDHHLYVPLRSMFERMGATVSASADGQTVTAAKTGASIAVTVGKHEVLLNGESRPLDVPPMLYRGTLYVPVRVISEALGAYVQWVPDRRVVVVRYLAAPEAPPPSAPSPPSAPRPVATPAPAPAPAQRSYRGFVQAAFAAPRTHNEFSAGQWCKQSYILSGGYAFKNSPLAVKVDFRQDVYVTSDNVTDAIANHYTQFATIDGGTMFTPVFRARQSSLDARLEYQVAEPRIYVGASYLHAANNFGYPQLSALGVGIEKLPDLRSGINFFGSAFYYPTASGDYTVSSPGSSNLGKSYRQRYGILRFDLGLALVMTHLPVYLYGGFNGDRYTAKQNAPIGQTHDGPYVGLGLKL